jgi:uncharacterized protein YPO0396
MNIYRFNCTYTDNLDIQVEANNQEEAEAIVRNLEYPSWAEIDRTTKRIRINKLKYVVERLNHEKN